MKNGLLLINLGTPDNCDTSSVRRYLAEFLSDKRVIDLPFFLRYILLYAFILPFRPKQSVKAYRAIWSENGSPLLSNSQLLAEKVQEKLGDNTIVSLGMRYGKPDLQAALGKLKDCHKITVLPLYPQYSSAATGSSIEKTLQEILNKINFPSISVIRDFYNHPRFINAQSQLIKPYIPEVDHIIFSYHGIPERQIKKAGCQEVCQQSCPNITATNQACYRAQCFETTRLIAINSNLNETQYSMAFQSRLGKTPWIKPYTDETLHVLRKKGIKKLAIACPSFVADCLETLEEIGIQAKNQWLKLGGEELRLIPCLNANDAWAEAIVDITNG